MCAFVTQCFADEMELRRIAPFLDERGAQTINAKRIWREEMKKHALIATISMLCAIGFASCSDSDDASSKAKVDNGAKCTQSSDCKSDYCDSSNTCADKPADVAKKDNDADCQANSECKSDYCDITSKKCADKPADVAKKDNGVNCAQSSECKSDFCDSSNKCADKPIKGDTGAGCLKNDDCASNLCDTTLHQCAKILVEIGEDCAQNDDCKSGFCDSSNKCAKKLGEIGDDCMAADDCKSGYCTFGGKCAEEPVVKLPNGEDCAQNDECTSGFCNSEKKCAAVVKKENDATCSIDAECKSNICKSNLCVAKPTTGEIENDARCTLDRDCKSGYCKRLRKCGDGKICKSHDDCIGSLCNDASYCADLKATSETCEIDDDCQSKYCDLSSKCKEKKANGDSCESNLDCLSARCSEAKQCTPSNLPTVESHEKASCSTSYSYVCLDNNYIGECQVWETGAGAYYITRCSNNTICTTYGTATGCYATCTEKDLGKTYSRCDPDYTDEGFSIGYFTYTCVKAETGYVYALTQDLACSASKDKGSGYFCYETGTSFADFDVECKPQ